VEGDFQGNIHGVLSSLHFFTLQSFNTRLTCSAHRKPKIRAVFQAIFERKSNDNVLILKYIPADLRFTRNTACAG
jgi:hypothetical protein